MGLLPLLLRSRLSGGRNRRRHVLSRARPAAESSGVHDQRSAEAARMIRRVAELAGVLLMLGVGSAASARDLAFFGNWARGDGKTHIRVEPCGGAFCGV